MTMLQDLTGEPPSRRELNSVDSLMLARDEARAPTGILTPAKRAALTACLNGAELDMETLVWTRGRAFPLAWLQERLRCPTCGSRRITIAYILPSERNVA